MLCYVVLHSLLNKLIDWLIDLVDLVAVATEQVVTNGFMVVGVHVVINLLIWHPFDAKYKY